MMIMSDDDQESEDDHDSDDDRDDHDDDHNSHDCDSLSLSLFPQIGGLDPPNWRISSSYLEDRFLQIGGSFPLN